MERERLLICEPNKAYRFLLRFNFNTTDHIIVGYAKSLDESLDKVDDIESQKIDCTTMILDGHFIDETDECEGARMIVDKVRAKKLDIGLVGFCHDPMKSRYGVDVDVEVIKPDLRTLMSAVDQLKH